LRRGEEKKKKREGASNSQAVAQQCRLRGEPASAGVGDPLLYFFSGSPRISSFFEDPPLTGFPATGETIPTRQEDSGILGNPHEIPKPLFFEHPDRVSDFGFWPSELLFREMED